MWLLYKYARGRALSCGPDTHDTGLEFKASGREGERSGKVVFALFLEAHKSFQAHHEPFGSYYINGALCEITNYRLFRNMIEF